MRIGIDFTWVQIREGRHGIGSYLRGLLAALIRLDQSNEYVLFAYSSPPAGLGPLPDRFQLRSLPVPSAGRARALLSHQIVLPVVARRLSLSLVHIPGVSVTPSLPGIPFWQPVPVVVTVHDLIPLLFPREILPKPRKRIFYRLMLRAVRRAAHLLCDSRATQQDLISHLGIPPGRTSVVPPAPDPLFSPLPEPPGDPRARDLQAGGYVLHVGGPVPHKNLPRLLEAMGALWTRQALSSSLVCVTTLPFDPVALCPTVQPHRQRIHVLCDVGTPFLRWLYQHALCLAFPSLYEGFGLPVLEAMASGCPVITSNISSLPELGGEAAVYVDPLEPASIQESLLTLIRDPERWAGLREAGLRNVKCFTYDATAEGNLAVYRAVSLRRSSGENRY